MSYGILHNFCNEKANKDDENEKDTHGNYVPNSFN